jgi:hypothetical protein
MSYLCPECIDAMMRDYNRLRAENERLKATPPREALAPGGDGLTDAEAVRRLRIMYSLTEADRRALERGADAIEQLAALRPSPAPASDALREDNERLRAAIRWALGEEGEFPEEPPPDSKWRRRYHWRAELRARCGDALRAPAPQDTGWREIATAPKDGTHVLLASAFGDWMPLPAPLQDTKEGGR